jgi:hypothetical protein
MLENCQFFYNVVGAAAPKPLHCEDSHPLMGVGATPRRVAPGQVGFCDFMKTDLAIHPTHYL